jgi:hypothetical protein
VGVSFLFRGCAGQGSSAWGEVWPTLSSSLRRVLQRRLVSCGEYLCGENAYRVWFVVPVGFIRKLMFYLHVFCVAAVGSWREVIVFPFFDTWRRCVDVLVVCAGMKCWIKMLI